MSKLSLESEPLEICVKQFEESNSAILADNSYVFRTFEKSEFIDKYYQPPDHTHPEWVHISKKFYEYNIPTVSPIRKCLEEKYPKLILKNYMPRSLSIQLIFEVILNGPSIDTVTEIDFTNSPFGYGACCVLAGIIENSKVLETINLTRCKIGYDGAKSLSEALEYSHLRSIILADCNLTDKGGEMILFPLILNEYCEVLDLSKNGLNLKSATQIAELLVNSEVLRHLNLNWNQLTPDDCMTQIMNALRKNVSLRYLDISWNGLYGPIFTKAFKLALKTHPSLVTLKMVYNRLAGDDIPGIAFGLRKCTTLEIVYLDGNPCTQQNYLSLIKIFKFKGNFKTFSLGQFVWLDSSVHNLAIKSMSENEDLRIIYKGKLLPNPPQESDFRAILIDRAKFLAMKPKKKILRRDMGHFFHSILDGDAKFCDIPTFTDKITEFKAKLDQDLVNQIGTDFLKFTGKGKTKKVDLIEMANYYLERHPTERPPTPPPVVPKPKPKKTKKNK